MAKKPEVVLPEPKSIMLNESKAISHCTALLEMPPDEMSDMDAVLAWSMLDLLEKDKLKPRRDELRLRLTAMAKAKGVQKGKSKVYTPEGLDGSVSCQSRAGKVVYDMVAIQALEDRINKTRPEGCPIRLLKETVTYTLDEALLEAAVQFGHLTVEDLKSVTSVAPDTEALVVKKPSCVKALLPGGTDD